MKRGDARELAVHLIYGRAFTGEEPEQVVSTRLDKEYYGKLAEENEVYAQRPDRFQLRYIDSVVTGVANREDELDNVIRQFSIGWDIGRISKLASGWRSTKSFTWTTFPPGLRSPKRCALRKNTTATIPARLSTES